ncbi:MotA/TolQ/ExbB proton channel family protein [Methylococcus sp. EFPC2]|uniref:MotA/TolQ/ExbB proton channel family protein n=1 Tax=Methylococcus sp. EFPC2 TaxID=2812648 RepID=UPI001968938E|nr:MotA/TolQ/ExbB proton channel family protein [Methylococcus sp. EFPC2]QSA96935.1 MotA/TolQ/ExbB proton channel family protein [Methylococcus sp. EFPC2]
METTANLGISHFLAQSDAVGKGIFAILLAMSVASWYFIVVKSLQGLIAKRRTARFLANFWNASSLAAVELQLEEHHPDEPFSHLAYHALASSRHHARHGANRLNEAGTAADFLTRAMRRVIDEETARLEWGFTLLASIGSTAPFIGLFGTVWGVYHALISIGMSGDSGLDKIAGPVGEALIMTGAGLAVAIPAVLAYNAFGRSNRLVLARLDAFAHDLFAFLTTGAHFAGASGEPKEALPQSFAGGV